ncbi:FtsX-like permease family protein [Motilibacter rhizosphaerae]|uniref:FtsX-like permease family protein n=1 Tax=Motilibacter rhizosphaerae TaxID=598652 RepID=A0A4Q7NXF0_9ACTN|nr:FtsX-like permease family protein [Motilibacter rhizosphaerae]RZS91072.1 FtsX-like permease family protein [Motilibacter rhizosphaerae]
MTRVLVLRRLLQQRGVLLVVTLVALLATTALTTMATLAVSSDTSAVRRTLGDASPEQRQVEVEGDLGGGAYAPADQVVVAQLRAAFGASPVRIVRQVTTAAYAPAGTDASYEVPPLTYVAGYDGAEREVRLLSGRWPRATGTGQPVEVLAPVAALAPFRLATGRTTRVTTVSTYAAARVRVVGTYAVRHPGSAYWDDDPTKGATRRGNWPLSAFSRTTIYGPLLGDPAVVRTRLPGDRVRWLADPQLAGLPAAQVEPLRRRVAGLQQALQAPLVGRASRVSAWTPLPALLEGLGRQRLVTRGTVLVAALLLVVLAASVLALTARLLAERRATEHALLRARGASGRQLVRLALAESVLLAALAAVLAPPLALGAYAVLARVPALARGGLAAPGAVPLDAELTALATAAGLVLLLTAPVLRQRASFAAVESRRPGRRAALSRGGLDLALLALAVVGYLQLRSYRSPLAGSGALRLDPVLVVSPALALLAGGVLALRVLPLVARAGGALAARSRGAAGALAGWQVGRRPARAAASVLLVALTVGAGSFAASYRATWLQAQRDQAAALTGPDVSLDGLPTAPLGTAAALRALPGATAQGPAAERDVELGGGGPGERSGDSGPTTPGRLVAVDASLAAAALHVRRDVLGADPAAALAPLRATAAPAGTLLPGSPARLSLRLALHVGAGASGASSSEVAVVVQDAAGVPATLPLGVVTAARPRTAVLDLAAAAGGRALAYPLRVVSVRALTALDPLPVRRGDSAPARADWSLRVDQLRTAAARGAWGAPLTLPRAEWHGQAPPADPFGDDPAPGDGSGPATAGGATLLATGGSLPLGPDGAPDAGTWTAWPEQPAVPAVLDRALAEALGVAAGADVPLHLDDTDALLVRVASVVRVLPPLQEQPYADRRPHLLVDRGALLRATLALGLDDAYADAWWAAVPDGAARGWAARAAAAVGARSSLSRTGLAAALSTGPARVGGSAGLLLLLLAAQACAGVGLAVHATVALRLRRLELAQLRALGLGRGQLAGVLAAEYAALALLGAVAGVAVGVGLGRLVGPLVTVGAEGGAPVPAVRVLVPWAPVLGLAAEVLVLVLLVVGGVVLALRRSGLGTALRIGEER